MGHLNINGLCSKMDFLKIFLSSNNLHILSVNETKIDKTILDADIHIDGYIKLFVNIREDLTSKKLSDLSKNNIEAI